MPLRGTVYKKERSVYNQRPTLQNQITALRHQVSRNKPETQYFRSSGLYSAPSAGVKLVNIVPTSNLIAASNFRENVTGDKWRNLTLDWKLTVSSGAKGSIRVICYVPRESGDRFAPSSRQLVEFPDPSTFWVISDDLLQKGTDDANTSKVYTKRFNFKSMNTLYDSNAASVKKGEICVLVIAEAQAVGGLFEYGYKLSYQNI